MYSGIVFRSGKRFDHYQWNLNGTPIQGANNNTYTPTGRKLYHYQLLKAPVILSQHILTKVYTCLVNTVKSMNVCSAGTPTAITPCILQLYTDSGQGTVQIIAAPVNRTLTMKSCNRNSYLYSQYWNKHRYFLINSVETTRILQIVNR